MQLTVTMLINLKHLGYISVCVVETVFYNVLDTDRDFEPTAEHLVYECDDEGTMEEEENLSSESGDNDELDELQKVLLFNNLTALPACTCVTAVFNHALRLIRCGSVYYPDQGLKKRKSINQMSCFRMEL